MFTYQDRPWVPWRWIGIRGGIGHRRRFSGHLGLIVKTTEKQSSDWREYLSPFKITLLAINAVCFGGCIVLLALTAGGGPLVLLTIGTGLSLTAGLSGAIVAGRK